MPFVFLRDEFLFAYSTSTVLSSPSMRRSADGRCADRFTVTLRPINESDMRLMSAIELPSSRTECSSSELTTEQLFPTDVYGPT